MSGAETVTLILACIAILISVVVGLINHSSATSAKESADAAQKQATFAAEQAEAAWASVNVANQQLQLNLDQFVEARENYRRSQQPILVVDIAPAVHDNGVLVLVIENLGPGVATNVRFRCDPPLVSTNDRSGRSIADRTAFRTGIPTLSPNRRLEFFFEVGFRLYQSDNPRIYDFAIEAESPAGPVNAAYRVDLMAYEGMWIGQASLSKLISSVDKISKGLTQVNASLSNPARFNELMELQTAETTALEDGWTSLEVVEVPHPRPNDTDESAE